MDKSWLDVMDPRVLLAQHCCGQLPKFNGCALEEAASLSISCWSMIRLVIPSCFPSLEGSLEGKLFLTSPGFVG